MDERKNRNINNKSYKKKKRKLKRYFKVFKRLLLLLLIIILGSCIWIFFKLSSLNNGNESSATESCSLKEPVNILLYGMDNVPGSSANRTDTIMMLHYEPKTSDITLVSFPRDTRITQDVYTPKVIDRTAKLTEVHYDSQLASDADTARDNLINTIKDFFGIYTINYYVSIDYSGFSSLIDVIGGVDVVPPYNMKYHDPVDKLEIDFDKGKKYHLNGEDALKFVRWRKNDAGVDSETDGSDLSRVENQRYFIKCVIDELSSPIGIIKTPSLISKGCSYIKTDLPANKILAYSMSILKSGTSNLKSETLKGTTKNIYGTDFFEYNPTENKEIIDLLNGNKIDSDQNIEDKGTLSIRIINSSAKDGLAGKLREKLVNQYGYTYDKIKIETGKEVLKKSSIVINTNSSLQNTDELCDEIGINKISRKESDTDIIINIGRDFSD